MENLRFGKDTPIVNRSNKNNNNNDDDEHFHFSDDDNDNINIEDYNSEQDQDHELFRILVVVGITVDRLAGSSTGHINTINFQRRQQNQFQRQCDVNKRPSAREKLLMSNIDDDDVDDGFCGEDDRGKPAVPVHCVVELSGAACQELGQPSQEPKVITDGYAILPSNTTLNNLVSIALEKLGIYGEATPARGALQIKNWKPLGLEQITENLNSATVGEILSDLGQLVTLRITLLSLPSMENERPEESAIACQTVKREELALPEETASEDLKESSARDLSSKDLMILNQLLNKQQHQQQLQLQQQQQQQQQSPLQQQQQQHQQQQKSRHSTDRFANQLLMNAAALQNHMQITEGMPVSSFSDKTTITENGVSDSMYQTLLQSFSSTTDKRTPCGSAMFSPERRDEILRTFIENAPKLSQGPGAALSAHLVSRKRPNENEVLDFSTTPKLSNNLASLANSNTTNGVTKFDDEKLHANKPRVRTTFDPETEVPQLHAWFQKDQHPTRAQIQDYVEQLNAARLALNRDKLLNVNNVVYWFKNARAAYKRRRLQESSANHLASVSSLDKLASAHSPNSMRGDMDSEHEASVSPPPASNGNNKLVPMSHTSLNAALQADEAATPLLDKWKEFEYQRRLAEAQRWQHLAAVMRAQQAQVAHQTLDLSVKPVKVQSCSSEAENDSADSSKEGCHARNESDASDDDDNDAWENRIANAQASSLALYGAGMYSNVAMPVVPFQSSGGINVNPNAQLEASGRKRNRTFIDPVSEVPRLERWFSDVTTHPHHAQIEEFTAELNSMEYRQKFPKLEPRNVQFWFKNRRAKYKRIEKSANSSMETTVTS
ncbi:uncharacterized protein LOC108864055 [Galendromus occidentalis]|uniref:Uncharacterized protein LOC108864055 n=1 Tax=Galendromus occidentalis TaxID=34638 RepID=A0AAJ7WI68_9ACAR|nr:uncharacterized protein LOC108864055 [Galendromus occidentalis]